MNIINRIKEKIKHPDDALRKCNEMKRRKHVPVPVKPSAKHPRRQEGFTWKDYVNELDYMDSPQYIKDLREQSDEVRDRMEWHIKEEAAAHTSWTLFVNRLKVLYHSLYDVWITRTHLTEIIILLVILNYYTILGVTAFLVVDCILVFLLSHWCFYDLIEMTLKNLCLCYGPCERILEKRGITNKETISEKGCCCRYRYRPFHESVLEYSLDLEYAYETWPCKLTKVSVAMIVLVVSSLLHVIYFEKSIDVVCFWIQGPVDTRMMANGTSITTTVPTYEITRKEYAIYEFIPTIYSGDVLFRGEDTSFPLLNCDYYPGFGFINYWKGIVLGVLGILGLILFGISNYNGPATVQYSRQLQKMRDCGVRFPKIPIDWGSLKDTRTDDILQTLINSLNILKIRMLKNQYRMVGFEREHLHSQLSASNQTIEKLNDIIRRQALNAEDLIPGLKGQDKFLRAWDKEKVRQEVEKDRLDGLREKQKQEGDIWEDPREDVMEKSAYEHLDLDIVEQLSAVELDSLEDRELELQQSVSVKSRFMDWLLKVTITFLSLFDITIHNLWSFTPSDYIIEVMETLSGMKLEKLSQFEKDFLRWDHHSVRLLCGSQDDMMEIIEDMKSNDMYTDDLPPFTFTYMLNNICCIGSSFRLFCCQIFTCCFCFVNPEHLFDTCVYPDLNEYREKFSRRHDLKKYVANKRFDSNTETREHFYHENLRDGSVDFLSKIGMDYGEEWSYQQFEIPRFLYCCCGCFDTIFLLVRFYWVLVFDQARRLPPVEDTRYTNDFYNNYYHRRVKFHKSDISGHFSEDEVEKYEATFLELEKKREEDIEQKENRMNTKAMLYYMAQGLITDFSRTYKFLTTNTALSFIKSSVILWLLLTAMIIGVEYCILGFTFFAGDADVYIPDSLLEEGALDEVYYMDNRTTDYSATMEYISDREGWNSIEFVSRACVYSFIFLVSTSLLISTFSVLLCFSSDIDRKLKSFSFERIFRLSFDNKKYYENCGLECLLTEFFGCGCCKIFLLPRRKKVSEEFYRKEIDKRKSEVLDVGAYDDCFPCLRSCFSRVDFLWWDIYCFIIILFVVFVLVLVLIVSVLPLFFLAYATVFGNFAVPLILVITSGFCCFGFGVVGLVISNIMLWAVVQFCSFSYFFCCRFMCHGIEATVLDASATNNFRSGTSDTYTIDDVPLTRRLYRALKSCCRGSMSHTSLSDHGKDYFLSSLVTGCCCFFTLLVIIGWALLGVVVVLYWLVIILVAIVLLRFLYKYCVNQYLTNYVEVVLDEICCARNCGLYSFLVLIGWHRPVDEEYSELLETWELPYNGTGIQKKEIICNEDSDDDEIDLAWSVYINDTDKDFEMRVYDEVFPNRIEKYVKKVERERFEDVLRNKSDSEEEEEGESGEYETDDDEEENEGGEEMVDIMEKMSRRMDDGDDYEEEEEEEEEEDSEEISESLDSDEEDTLREYVEEKKRQICQLKEDVSLLVQRKDKRFLKIVDGYEQYKVKIWNDEHDFKERTGVYCPRANLDDEVGVQIFHESVSNEEEYRSIIFLLALEKYKSRAMRPHERVLRMLCDDIKKEEEEKKRRKEEEEDEEDGEVDISGSYFLMSKKLKEKLKGEERKIEDELTHDSLYSCISVTNTSQVDRLKEKRRKLYCSSSKFHHQQQHQHKNDDDDEEETKLDPDDVRDEFEDGRVFQRWYHCIDCGLTGTRGICHGCSRRCHEGHEVKESPLSPSRFTCVCIESEYKPKETTLIHAGLRSLAASSSKSHRKLIHHHHDSKVKEEDSEEDEGEELEEGGEEEEEKESTDEEVGSSSTSEYEESDGDGQEEGKEGRKSKKLKCHFVELQQQQKKSETNEEKEEEILINNNKRKKNPSVKLGEEMISDEVRSYVEQEVCTAQLKEVEHPVLRTELKYIQKGYRHKYGTTCRHFHNQSNGKWNNLICESCKNVCHVECEMVLIDMSLLENGGREKDKLGVEGYCRFVCSCGGGKEYKSCICLKRQYREDIGLTKENEPLEDYKKLLTEEEKQAVYEKLADDFNTLHHKYKEDVGGVKIEKVNLRNTIDFKKKIRRLIDSQYEKHLCLHVLERIDEELGNIDRQLSNKKKKRGRRVNVLARERTKVKKEIHKLVEITKTNLQRIFYDDYQEGEDLCKYFLRFRLYGPDQHPLPKTRLEKISSPLETLYDVSIKVYVKGKLFLNNCRERLYEDYLRGWCIWGCWFCRKARRKKNKKIHPIIDKIMDLSKERYVEMETSLREEGVDLLALKRIKNRYKKTRIKKHSKIYKKKRDLKDLEVVKGYDEGGISNFAYIHRYEKIIDHLKKKWEGLIYEKEKEVIMNELKKLEDAERGIKQYEEDMKKIEECEEKISKLSHVSKIIQRRDERRLKRLQSITDMRQKEKLAVHWKKMEIERKHRMRRWRTMLDFQRELRKKWRKEVRSKLEKMVDEKEEEDVIVQPKKKKSKSVVPVEKGTLHGESSSSDSDVDDVEYYDYREQQRKKREEEVRERLDAAIRMSEKQEQKRKEIQNIILDLRRKRVEEEKRLEEKITKKKREGKEEKQKLEKVRLEERKTLERMKELERERKSAIQMKKEEEERSRKLEEKNNLLRMQAQKFKEEVAELKRRKKLVMTEKKKLNEEMKRLKEEVDRMKRKKRRFLGKYDTTSLESSSDDEQEKKEEKAKQNMLKEQENLMSLLKVYEESDQQKLYMKEYQEYDESSSSSSSSSESDD